MNYKLCFKQSTPKGQDKMDNMSFEELLNQTLKEIRVGQTVTGNIININAQGEIFVDLGYKADGIIPKSEFSYNENDDPTKMFKVGDRITADVIKLNDGLGNVLLSYKEANSKIVKQEFERDRRAEAFSRTHAPAEA